MKMKNYKLIPLLAISVFLVGCNTSKNAKAPSFAKLGNEVEYADWVEQFNQPDLLGAWSNPTEQHIPSTLATVKQYGYAESKLTSNKKAVETYSSKDEYKATLKADMNNLRLGVVVEENSKTESKVEKRVITDSENTKIDISVQIGEVTIGENSEEYMLNIDNSAKQYSLMNSVATLDAQQRKTAFENFVLSFLNNGVFPATFIQILENYPSMTVDQKSNYKFYQNGKIFTVTFATSFAEADNYSGDTIKALTKVEVNGKFQLDATKGESFKFKSSIEEVYETEFLGDFYDNSNSVTRKLGDKYEGKSAQYYDVDFKAQDIKLNEVDLSKYILIA